jgi:hypothetical protein
MSTAPFTVSAADAASFVRDGYFVLRGVFDVAELNALRPTAPAPLVEDTGDALFDRVVIFGNPKYGEDPTRIVKLEGLGRLPADGRGAELVRLFHRIALDARLEAIARQLYGASVQLMKDKYIFKGKGGGDGFLPHQDMDFIYSRAVTEAVNFGIAFDTADASNGALEVCTEPHSYAHFCGRLAAARTETANTFEASAHLRFEHVCTEPGDVIVFSAWLLHRSAKNTGFSRDRNIYYVTYGVPGYCAGVDGASGVLYNDCAFSGKGMLFQSRSHHRCRGGNTVLI